MSNNSIVEMLRRTPGCPKDLCERMFRFFKRLDLTSDLGGIKTNDYQDDFNVIYFSHIAAQMAQMPVDEYETIVRGLNNDSDIEQMLNRMGMSTTKRQADFCCMMLMLFNSGSIDRGTEL